MGRIDKLRESRKGATVMFTKFTRLKDSHKSSLFCCFEGDDSKYYGSRIENILQMDIDKLHFFNCGGKSEVIRFYEMINKNDDYKEVKIAYFVDRDYDRSLSSIYNYNIYETPFYSIENFYTTTSAFKKILKNEFNLNEFDEDYQICLKLFLERQNEFHEKTTLLNAWLWCQRDLYQLGKSSRLNLSNFNLTQVIPKISLTEIIADYDKEKLESIFPEAIIIPDEILDFKIGEINKLNKQEIFRGKFEIDFLFSFIEAIKAEFKNESPIIKKQLGVQINQSKKNLIAEFSQYAFTPDCLKKYLKDLFNKNSQTLQYA